MKKLFAFLATAILCVACALGVAGCSQTGDGKSFKVYVPDGAPALSVAGIDGSFRSEYFQVNTVKADTITAYVTGAAPQADFAVMPVNAAVKLLGDGTKYKMLGTVTNGNLFLMKKQNGEALSSAADLQKLIGKTVGVINLENVPGLTFKVILSSHGLQFNELKDGAAVALDKVNLKNVTAQEAVPTNADCDYFVVPEPAASTKVAATQGKLSFAGSLQTLYGGENGYPQAVAVVKTELIETEPDYVEDFILSFSSTANWLKNEETTAEAIANAVKNTLVGDISPTFTADNLSKTVIANCGINFIANNEGKHRVLDFMQKLNAVSDNAWKTPTDGFFY